MWLSDMSVKRPVVAIVLSLLLCVFGLVAFWELPVREMPDVDNPVVTVSTSYPGAAASIMESQITTPLEDQLSGISGVDTLTSISRNGISRITITFDLGWDLSEGLSDVRDAVSKAQRRLPDDIDSPVISKDSGGGEAIMYINLTSSEWDRTQLSDYAERTLLDHFTLLNGVSSVSLNGQLERVMAIRLNAQALVGRGVSVTDVENALKKENIEAPGGSLRNEMTTMTVRTDRVYRSVRDLEFLVVKTTAQGVPIYLKDVASVQMGAKNETTTYRYNGEGVISLGIIAMSDANPLSVASAVKQQVEQLQRNLPSGVALTIDYDATGFIKQAISEVYGTLWFTGVLVVLVLYLFLGQARATLIPAITVPVSLISAFMVAYFLGFSINLLTLMALILAIGLVVDDAIVVVENIYHQLEKGASPLVAAYRGTREVGFAVIATTVVLVMVFLPITFMDGMAGPLFTEFAVLLSVAVIVSSLVALTLAPVLACRLFKKADQSSVLSRWVDAKFVKMMSGYRAFLTWTMRFRRWVWVGMIAVLCGTGALLMNIPSQLAPASDRGVLFAFVKGAEGASYERMVGNLEQIESRLLPLIGKEGIRSISMQTPAFGGRASDQTGFIVMVLDDWAVRSQSATQVLNKVRQTLGDLPDVQVWPFMPGFGGRSSEPVQFVLTGSEYASLFEAAEQLKAKAEASGMMSGVDINYAENTPEWVVEIDPQRAATLGISASEIASTVEIMLGGKTTTRFLLNGEEYDVHLQGNVQDYRQGNDLSRLQFKTREGQWVPLSSVARIEAKATASALNHHQKQKAITLSANITEGHTLGEALTYLNTEAKTLPMGIAYDYSGESKNFYESQSALLWVFCLALLVTYLVLAAQFESFVNPFVVMLTVPMGLLGGLFGLLVFSQTLNVFSQIGMVLLIGIVTKNGILIVEFANQLRDKGMAFEESIIEASVRRLRPILMTAMTTFIGALPLIFSSGAGSESRLAVGVVIAFGVLLSTVMTLWIIPSLYRMLCVKTRSPNAVAADLDRALAEDQASPS